MNNATLRYIMLFFMSGDYILDFITPSIVKKLPEAATLLNPLSSVSLLWIPIAVFLAVQAVVEYENQVEHFFGLLGAAILAEVPYDLMISGKFLDWSHQNPLLGVTLTTLLMILTHKAVAKWGHWGALGLVAVMLSGGINLLLNIDYPFYTAIIATIYLATDYAIEWFDMPHLTLVAAALVAMVLFKWPLNFASLGVLFPLMYNNDWGFENRYVPYIGYISILLLSTVFQFLI